MPNRINEEKEDQGNEDDEGQTFDRVGVNLLTVLLHGLMRCSACEDGLMIQAEVARAARDLRAQPQSALRATRVHFTLVAAAHRRDLIGPNPSEQDRMRVDFAAILAFPDAGRSAWDGRKQPA